MVDFCVRTIYNYCADKKGGAKMSPSQGRPHSENPKSERIYIRVTPSEKAEIQAAAKETGLSILELIKKGIQAVKKK
jgi:hypothetical protein